MLDNVPFTSVTSDSEWSNFSGSLGVSPVPFVCTPEPLDDVSTKTALRPHGDAISAILRDCFAQDPPEPVRTLGTRLSFSRVVEPSRVAIETANMDVVWQIWPEILTDDYRNGRIAAGYGLFFVEGGTVIGSLNRRLGEKGFALQTSGAGDAHRIAGCVATGTHGAALRIGAVHDTIRAVHVVVAPNKALFIQPASGRVCKDDFAGWLETQTGIPTKVVNDDDAFRTALVSLGSVGFVFSFLVEAAPLYRLRRKTFAAAWDDAALWQAIETMDTCALHPDVDREPYHFEIVMNPYPPAGAKSAYVKFLWSVDRGNVPFTSPAAIPPDASSDTMGLVGSLADDVDEPLIAKIGTLGLGAFIAGQLAKRFENTDGTVQFPGEMFGPTSLPRGKGASTEIAVSQVDAATTLAAIFDVLRTEASLGRHLLGAVAVRFVGPTTALLGMNQADMNCFIELPSVRSSDVSLVYSAIWKKLTDAGIRFTCHWGQLHGMTAQSVASYYQGKEATWKATREALLETATACAVFGAPILADVGLDYGSPNRTTAATGCL